MKNQKKHYTKRSDIKEFIKIGADKYIIKDSNGTIVNEKEKLKLEKRELIIEDVNSECGKKATLKIKKVDKKLKEVEDELNSIEKTISTKKRHSK